jgi:hypothetical protein
MERKQLEDAVVNFELKFVDGVFFIEDTLGELFIRFQDGVDGLMDGALGETAHPQETLFQFVQVFFEVAFHGLFPFSSLQVRIQKCRTLAALGMTVTEMMRGMTGAEAMLDMANQPKRPVM